MFRRLNYIFDQLCEVELVKPGIKHREPIIVGFFILQYAKQRMLELHYNFFKKFCDADKYEEFEMDTDSLYLALSKEIWKTVFSLRSEASGMRCVREIAQTPSLPTQHKISCSECVETHTRNTIRGSQVSSRKNSDVQKCCVYAVKRIVAMIERVTSTSFAAKV